MRKILFFAVVLLIPIIGIAHQPRDVEDNQTNVIDPEISKAFYATLEGEPHIYRIDSAEDFNLYVGITVPLTEKIETDFNVSVYENDPLVPGSTLITNLSADSSEWTEFYEPFGGDTYLSGPEYEDQQKAGMYEIIVSSPDNKGQYVLAVGKIESFPLIEIINTYRTLPGIKEAYFDKPWYTAFLNIMTLGLIILLLLAIGVVFLLIKAIKSLTTKKQDKAQTHI